jgi:hypothetical protein
MPRESPRRVGVEHELRVWTGTELVDFRQVLPGVAGGLRALDPGDPRARRLPSGVVLTADGREAELATPPYPWCAGVPGRLDAVLATERTVLAARVAEVAGADRLTGFSTHVNLSVPDDRVVDIGRRFARHGALATALVAEPASSSGLLVRPRRGRLEIGGEYAEGVDLVALVTFVGAAVAALLADAPPPELPAPVIVPAREKFGWYLPVEGPYADLVQGRVPGTDLIATAWEWARPWCVGDGVDPAPVDRLVAGAPLRLEQARAPGVCTIGPPGGVPAPTARDTGPRRLAGGIEAETLWLTWAHVVWAFGDGRRQACAVLPVEDEDEFLTRLDRGELDDEVRRELGRRLGRRRLLVHADIDHGVWWHEVRPGALVPAERAADGTVPRVSRRRAARAHRQAARAGDR